MFSSHKLTVLGCTVSGSLGGSTGERQEKRMFQEKDSVGSWTSWRDKWKKESGWADFGGFSGFRLRPNKHDMNLDSICIYFQQNTIWHWIPGTDGFQFLDRFNFFRNIIRTKTPPWNIFYRNIRCSWYVLM